MDSSSVHERRILWAFWIACGLAAVGGVAPFLLGGSSNRISGVVFPYALGAIALGACAVLYPRGRSVTTALYFVASLAIVYGILALVAVPLRLAVIGTCPPEPARCALGFERPLTSAEDTALAFAIGMGIVAILTGFFALVILYRRPAVTAAPTPPARRIEPVAADVARGVSAETAPPPTPAPEPAPEPEPVPAEPEPQLELSPPAETPELPAPTPEEAAEPNVSAPAAKPRRRRTLKAPPDVTPPPASDS